MLFTKENAPEWFDYWFEKILQKELVFGQKRIPDGFICTGINIVGQPNWAALRYNNHENRTASLIIPYNGEFFKDHKDRRLYLFFTDPVNGLSISYEKWISHPLIVEKRIEKLINEVLGE